MLKEPPPTPIVQDTRHGHIRNLSVPNQPSAYSERQPLIRSRSYDEYDASPEDEMPGTRLAGGTVLGIHNLAVVLPQFVVRISGTVQL